MSTNNSQSLRTVLAVDRKAIDAAILRGRRERSKMFWTILASVFGAGKAPVADRHEALDRNATFAR